MINGVKLKKLKVHTDFRGNFMEILRKDDSLLKEFGQAALSSTFPGVIKAFHWHKNQDDVWYVLSGNVQVVLYDKRDNSNTKHQTQTIYMGENSEKQILFIPRGVVHGYKVLGKEPAIVLYFTSEVYDSNNPDEERIQYNDPEIGYDWETKHK